MKGATMSEIIKCPICHKMAGIRYDINRVYQSRCQNMECRETVTVTAPSEAVAEELFYRFEKGTNQPQLTIPKSVADELEEEIEEAYSNDYIRSYSDVGAYMEVITDGLDEDSKLYKFMFPDNDALLGCSHRNLIYLYLVDNDLVKVVEGIDDNY